MALHRRRVNGAIVQLEAMLDGLLSWRLAGSARLCPLRTCLGCRGAAGKRTNATLQVTTVDSSSTYSTG